ncbi:MAG: tetratricopeptide repeat protein [Prochloraceae cyanobacterium]|nr:tetratricopeptide repeat protein [Prochloraceae cyanobacterium]
MSDFPSLRDRYLEIIDNIVDITLKGKIRSKVQVYKMLVDGIEPGTGEIFERCLQEKISQTQAQLETKIKASRILRALQTIEGEWERWQKENRTTAKIDSATEKIVNAEADDRFPILLKTIDPNQSEVLTLEQLQQLATALKQASKSLDEHNLGDLASGIRDGINSWQKLEGNLVSWIYEQGQSNLGFGGTIEQKGPWGFWEKKVSSPLLQQLFQTLASNQSLVEFAAGQKSLEPAAWVELAVVLQLLQRGLIQFFDQRIYNAKLGAKLSISTFLTFAVIWSQLGNGLNSPAYADGCMKITLQILRNFSSREYFPLYGGIFASFSGEYIKEAIDYLDEPLQQGEANLEKARILTLLGYSFKAQSRYEKAIDFHQKALEIARKAGDKTCEIANLNHLSRIYVAHKNYDEAINYSQRALILSRQSGDSLGQANALSNLGYSEVLRARQLENIESEVYETAINYLQQGLELSEKLSDRQSQALCYSSTGIAYVILEQYQAAIKSLNKGLEAAQFSGDLYLQGINFAYLAEAYYGISVLDKAICNGCLGMYLLEQIGASEWRQSAGLLTVLKGQQGEKFEMILQQVRKDIIAVIGVDGYDYLPELLEKYA